MASTMNYSFRVVSPPVVFNNAFASDKFTYIGCNSAPPSNPSSQQQGRNFLGNLQTLRIQGTASFPDINPSELPAIVVKGYRDEAGTELILEPTAAEIHPDMTGGKHSVVYSLDLIINLAPTDVLYLFIKTAHLHNGSVNDGRLSTFSVEELEVVCRRN